MGKYCSSQVLLIVYTDGPHVVGMMMHKGWSLATRCQYCVSYHAANILTSLVDVSKNLARVLLARPSMFIVPRKLVLRVLIGLYLRPKLFMPVASTQC